MKKWFQYGFIALGFLCFACSGNHQSSFGDPISVIPIEENSKPVINAFLTDYSLGMVETFYDDVVQHKSIHLSSNQWQSLIAVGNQRLPLNVQFKETEGNQLVLECYAPQYLELEPGLDIQLGRSLLSPFTVTRVSDESYQLDGWSSFKVSNSETMVLLTVLFDKVLVNQNDLGRYISGDANFTVRIQDFSDTSQVEKAEGVIHYTKQSVVYNGLEESLVAEQDEALVP